MWLSGGCICLYFSHPNPFQKLRKALKLMALNDNRIFFNLKKTLMKHLILMLIILLNLSTTSISQHIPSKAGSTKEKNVGVKANSNTKPNSTVRKDINLDTINAKKKTLIAPVTLSQRAQDVLNPTNDSLIKVKLVWLAMNNPQLKIADASIQIAKSDILKANNSWLSSVNASANINEFVVNGSPGALYYPKYNFGLSIPFDIASKTKNLKKTANENLIINKELKKDKEEAIKAQVLIAYENYKEERELVLIEKTFIEYKFSADEGAQQSFTDGEITIDEMNKMHQAYLQEKEKLITKQRGLNVAIIMLEQIVGVPLADAIKL